MKIWELYKEEELLARIDQNDSDFPWLYGVLLPEIAFEKYRVLFERTSHFNNIEDWESSESEKAFEDVDELSLRIVDTTRNVEYEHVLINIEGYEAGWRCYSDKHSD